jgi:hypothetical protein
MKECHFQAPWSLTVKAVTVVASLVCLGGAAFNLVRGQLVSSAGLLALVLFPAFFMIRGYSVTHGLLLIHRLGWTTRFDLSKLSKVNVDSDAMARSVSLWGIRGWFGIVGYFRNKTLGLYQGYATDPRKAVVLEFGGKRIVVTPDSPAEFAAAVQQAAPLRRD